MTGIPEQTDSTANETPLVTVYITSYNYDQYLQTAIESVLGQNFRDFELIIIDDGSTDNSREIIREYTDHPKTRVIFQRNKGLNKSIDVAIKASRGKYVMRLDADDFLDQNALLVLSRELEQDESAALVFPDYYYVDKNDEVIGQEHRNDFSDVTVPDRPAHGACTLFRKRVLEEVGSYSTDYTCQDGYDIWIKIINKYNVKNVNLPLFYYRQHGENLTENTERILDTREEIKTNYVEENGEIPSILGIVPIRGKIVDPESPILETLGDKPIIEWTFEAIENTPQIRKTVVSTPDPEVLEYVENREGNIETHERDIELARENVPLDTTLKSVCDGFNTSSFDGIAQLTPESPLRTSRSIKEAIATLEIFPVDEVIGVLPEEDQFYIHDGNGLQPVGGTFPERDLRLERERLFRRSGGLKVIDIGFFLDDNRGHNPKIGHVILQEEESIKIKNEDGLKKIQNSAIFD